MVVSCVPAINQLTKHSSEKRRGTCLSYECRPRPAVKSNKAAESGERRAHTITKVVLNILIKKMSLRSNIPFSGTPHLDSYCLS